MWKNQSEPKYQRTQERKMPAFHKVDWQHVYRDWRFMVGGCVVLVIVVTYLLTGDFFWRPNGPWHRETEKVSIHAADLPPAAHP